MFFRKEISQLDHKIEQDTTIWAEYHALTHYYAGHESSIGSDRLVSRLEGSLDELLSFRAYLKGYADSPCDSLHFYAVITYEAKQWLNGWNNYREARRLMESDNFINNPSETMWEMSVNPAKYFAIHSILVKVYNDRRLRDGSLADLIKDMDTELINKNYLGK